MNLSAEMKSTTPMFDPALPGLNLALDPTRLEKELATVLLGPGVIPLPGTLRVLGVQPLKHRVGRRCSLVLSVRVGERKFRLFAKAFQKGRGSRIVEAMDRTYDALPETGSARLARTLHFLESYDLFIGEFVDGDPVSHRIYSDRPGRTGRLVGKALAGLHNCKVQLPRRWDVESELKTTARSVDRVSEKLKDGSGRLMEQLERHAATLENGKITPIHRDFYPEQLMTVDRACYILDLDDIRMGDPAVDLGNFLAHLSLHSLQRTDRPDGYQVSRDQFLSSYLLGNEFSEAEERRIRFYEATSLTRLAGVYAIRSAWAESLPVALLAEANRVASSLD